MDMQRIGIAGAGVCGLMTALVCARRGYDVQVFERRFDPFSEAGSERLRSSQLLLEQANDVLGRGDDASAILSEAGNLRSQVWGTRQRCVVLDGVALAYLATHGVETGDFPVFEEMIIDWGTSGPRLCMQYGARSVSSGTRLNAEQLVLQRDWEVQPSIADIEKSLRSECERSGVQLAFNTVVSGITPGPESLVITANGVDYPVDLAVIADGGGDESAASDMGVSRTPVRHEYLDVAVFAASDERVRGQGFVSPGGWTGYGRNGRIITVDVRRTSEGRRSAYEIGRQLGVTTRLVEPPMAVSYDLDRADRFRSGKVLLVGDAAVRGSPLFALGAQYALLWAQTVEDLLVDVEAGDDAMARFDEAAEHMVDLRLEFECGCLDVLDAANASERSFADALASPALLDAIRIRELSLRGSGTGAMLDLHIELDFATSGRRHEHPEIRALKNLGLTHVRFSGAIEWHADRVILHPMESHPLTISSAVEDIRIESGEVSIGREGRSWVLRISGSHIHRGSGLKTPLEAMVYECNEAFIDAVLKSLPDALIGSRLQLGFVADFPKETELPFGKARLHSHSDSQVDVKLTGEAGKLRLSATLKRGILELQSFSELLPSVPLISDIIDTFVGVGSCLTRKVELDMPRTGPVWISITPVAGWMALRIPINASIAREFMTKVLVSAEFSVPRIGRLVVSAGSRDN